MDLFISKDILDILSYKSTLGQSLKQISLRETPLQLIMEDIAKYRSTYVDVLVQENLIGSRFKSDDSIMRKYKKTIRKNGGFKQCFNDILGFRLRFDEYPENYPEYFRVVDLRHGKRMMMGTVQYTYTIRKTIWHILSKFSCGVEWIISLIYGVISMFTSIKMLKFGKNFMTNMNKI